MLKVRFRGRVPSKNDRRPSFTHALVFCTFFVLVGGFTVMLEYTLSWRAARHYTRQLTHEISREEFAVWSMAIDREIKRHFNSRGVVLNKTIGTLKGMTIRHPKEFFPDLADSADADFCSQNTLIYEFRNLLKTAGESILISERPFGEDLQSEKQRAHAFRAKYHCGLSQVSRVGFNLAMDQAVVYCDYNEGCGSGDLTGYVLNKRKGVWSITKSKLLLTSDGWCD
jgi:hypothetical protein